MINSLINLWIINFYLKLPYIKVFIYFYQVNNFLESQGIENDLEAKNQTDTKSKKLAVAKDIDAPCKPKRGTIKRLNAMKKIATDTDSNPSWNVFPA